MPSNVDESPQALLQKAWEVNAYLASERDRYRDYYKQVRKLVRSGLPTDLIVDRIREVTLDSGDVLDPADASQA